jgi:hypothetical protein
MSDELKVVEPEAAVPVAKVKKPKTDTTTEMLEAADSEDNADMSPDISLDKKAFWTGFAEKCMALGVNGPELYKYAKEKEKKKDKAKGIRDALGRDTPKVSAGHKALTDKNKGEAPTYENRPKQPPFDTWTKNQWEQFVASTGHKINKKASVLGGLAGAGLGGGAGIALTPEIFRFLRDQSMGGNNPLTRVSQDDAQALGGLLGAGAGGYLGHKATEEKEQQMPMPPIY